MSLHHTEDVTCPECGHTQMVQVWQSLNADLDPEAVPELLRGNLNVLHCPCGLSTPLAVPLAYHDMAGRLYVQHAPWEMLDALPEWLDNFDAEGRFRVPEELGPLGDALPEYMRQQHVVFSMGELVRYVLFRRRLAERHGRGGTPE